MLCLTCSIIPSVDLARYRVSRAKDLVSGNVKQKSFVFDKGLLNSEKGYKGQRLLYSRT